MTSAADASTEEIYEPNAIVDKWTSVWENRHQFEVDLLSDTGQLDNRRYVVSMFAYPSGDLHMGHAEVYSISDAIARFIRMRGFQTLMPVGWDSFGLPAENAALKRNLDPREWTYANIATQAESFKRLGISFDWRTRLHTSDETYYRWNQWLFLRLYRRGLAFRKDASVNWCPNDQTVLANEQVIQGRCERCRTEVVRRSLTQWFFKTTDYAQRLLDDMAQLEGNWPAEILAMQRNWIGRSEGAYIDFAIEGSAETVRIFTTRPDTVFGATFFVVAFDAPLAERLCTSPQREQFESYRAMASMATDIERLSTERAKTGVFLGRHAINPVNGEHIPIYASDYVLADYGTGAVMAVPAHDQRDLDFAKTMNIPVRVVVDTGAPDPNDTGLATAGNGVLVNSGSFDGMNKADAIPAITGNLEQRGIGKVAVTYRLRDWLLSRQRYWGTPIPIIHCSNCGEVPVPDEQLPVRLPETGYELRPGDGKAPLESAEEWVRVPCPACGGDARRDTDTMDTFVDSSWYFLRYPNPDYPDGPFDPVGISRWLPVDEYIGGKEHATGHLMYARFMTKALHDLGLVPFTEPFTRLINQGQVLMDGKAMSKSLGNLVNLREQISQYGPDAVRVTMIFAGPAEDDIDWADVSPQGSVKWLARVWRLAGEVGPVPAGQGSSRPDDQLARTVHRLIDRTTASMDGKRLNVAVAQLMQLTNVLRKAVDGAQGPGNPVVRDGIQALVRMLSCFAPFTAEECWQRLGHEPSVSDAGWPAADPELVATDSTTCIIQVDGKLRDRVEVATDADEESLRALAVSSEKAQQALAGRTIAKVIVRAPKLVNIVSAS